MDNELREWLGIAPADFPIYLAILCLVIAYFVRDISSDIVLIVGAIVACIVSCFIGMKKDPKVSGFTNGVKLISYPTCLLGCIILSMVNFVFWN